MSRLSRLAAAVALFALPLTPVRALCIYHGELYATTTLAQEFRDSRWVVRARVLSAATHWSDESVSWTLYRLQVLHRYKGAPPNRITLYTERNSGGFYLDRGAAPDLGGEYLLFLNPVARRRGNPPAARGATWVNYNCGRSRPWAAD